MRLDGELKYDDIYYIIMSSETDSYSAVDDGSIACVSGYFDPIHVGHIEYFKQSKNIAQKLMVIVNNDEQAVLKKGRAFMPVDERIRIIRELRCVDYVVKSIDTDRTVCRTLASVNPRPTFFCNGGDQNNYSIPEAAVCDELGIELRDGFGDKIQSSSWLIQGAGAGSAVGVSIKTDELEKRQRGG
jgi:cytidyltransferase-like protein